MRTRLFQGDLYKHQHGYVREIIGFGYDDSLGSMVYYSEHHDGESFHHNACKESSFKYWIKKANAVKIDSLAMAE